MATPNAFRKWLGSALLTGCAAVAGGLYFWPSPSAATAAATVPAVPVRVSTVAQRSVPVLISALGTVRSQRSVEIRPQVDGLLVELPVKEGQFVKRGDLLARIDDRSIVAALDQAKAQLAVAQAQLASASLDLSRYQSLVKTQAISTQTLDQQRALVAQLQATVRTEQASVAANQVQLSHTRIHAPNDGRVGIHNVHEGSFLRVSEALGLFSVVQLDPISVEVALPQVMLPQLQALLSDHESNPAPLQAYAGDGGELLGEGRLALIDNRVSSESGTIRVKADFANADGRLWPDQSVTVNLQVQTLPDALVVPQRALRQGVDQVLVWRVVDGSVAPQPVQVRHSDNEFAVVSGLAAGDTVVVDGHSRLRPGVAVRILDEGQAQAAAVAGRRVF
ncbi:MAG: efflux RND transporter periplasmic adaptor subunit [Gammaproteobacteria bacterium]|nr:efflux RND transporter periplasmic adaptor subunit [Gammaproteobacteria bacterium]MBU1490240.1 efflux RND transporter periplasmic adaptor subunit [Gammaproteobacteria bacterium]MBU2065386.1 efflux RND transporter periplasmic adaptor subunit [Gammaproteobacteria bacterium]MBU2139131.1 efflux RND transporter periplasmic adaptor subunit [Gammaproteobacteria bacterium]MBU2215483.1 efflux RND transporter periplasmic adaptor subunit [Gammaproteobacteria bacterium]